MTLSGLKYIHSTCNKKVLSIFLLKIYGLNPTEYIGLSITNLIYKLGIVIPLAPKETASWEKYVEHTWILVPMPAVFAICSYIVCSSYHCLWKKGENKWTEKKYPKMKKLLLLIDIIMTIAQLLLVWIELKIRAHHFFHYQEYFRRKKLIV